MDKAKERIKHGFVQVCKGDPLARLADEMEVIKAITEALAGFWRPLSGI